MTSVFRYNLINTVSMACKTGVKGCSELTRMWYRQWMKNPDTSPYGKCFSKPEIWIQFIPVIYSHFLILILQIQLNLVQFSDSVLLSIQFKPVHLFQGLFVPMIFSLVQLISFHSVQFKSEFSLSQFFSVLFNLFMGAKFSQFPLRIQFKPI